VSTVRRRLPSVTVEPPVVVAIGAFLVGIIDIVSSVTPALTDRLNIFQAMLPVDAGDVAGSVTFASGVALVWLSGGLARRKRRAWMVALGVVTFAAAAHLSEGFDIEEAIGSLALIVALLRLRRWFDVPGDPTSLRPLVGGLAVALVAWAIVGSAAGDHLNRITDLGFEIVLAAGAFWALHQWLRAHREPCGQTDADFERARALVAEHGEDSLSFFALRRDRRYVFSRAGSAFLAYRVVAGCALVAGDPIGDPTEVPGLVADFAAVCRERGWRLVVLHASDRWLELYRDRGMRAFPSGDEAVLDPTRFSLEGRAIRKVRQSVARLERARFTFRVASPEDLSDVERTDVDAVTREWLAGAVDRGFSMAMDDLHAHPQARFALATDGAGRVRGYLHLVPSSRGYSLSAMRRGRDTPNGLMEYLIAQTTLWAAPAGVEEISLNFSALADVLRAGVTSPVHMRLARAIVLRLDRVFQLERLFSFNRKFHPEWRTRYICYERAIDVPVLSLATLHAERLIAPPARFAGRRRAAR
jgi:lysyl-tRNA synthetase class 2